jgi:membrane fusion protein (multidrug efflux system)
VGLISLALPACNSHAAEKESSESEHHKIVVTSPLAKDVVVTQTYVGQIQSKCHIEVCALEGGRLDEIPVREGQVVKQGDVLFRIVPNLYQAKLEAEAAEAQLAQLEFDNTKKLFETNVVSSQEVAIQQAKLDKARAKAKQAAVELEFTIVRAPFTGLIDRLQKQQGSAIKEGEVLTTLSDNSVMWVRFNVPESRYYEYMAGLDQDPESQKIELVLATGAKFKETGKIAAIGAKCNNETGTFAFRADFPNPDGLLRHGQSGKVLINRTLKNALVIPQRAVFEVLDKRFVFVVGKDGVAHPHEIEVQNELDDIFVVKKGLTVDDRIILEGVRQVRDGTKIDSEFRKPEEVMANQKTHAE